MCFPNREHLAKLLENAHYIGLMQVLAVERETQACEKHHAGTSLPLPLGKIYTVQPIQSFTSNELTEPFKVFSPNHAEAWHGEVNDLFINAVLTAGSGVIDCYPQRKLAINDNCGEMQKVLQEKGYKMPEEKSEAFLSLEKECLETGGNFVLENNRFVCASE